MDKPEADLLPAVLLSAQVFGLLGLRIRGYNWVRPVLIVIFCFAIIIYPIAGIKYFELHYIFGILAIIQTIIQGVVIRFLLSGCGKGWFH